jgi:hypothetical protein
MEGNVMGTIADVGVVVSKRPVPELAAAGLGVAAFAVNFLQGPERLMATFVALLVVVLVGGLGMRATAVFSKSDGLRVAGMGVAIAGALLAAGPSLWNLYPGTPDAEVDVTPGASTDVAVPAGVHRVLVSGHLPHDGTSDEAQYDLALGDTHVAGEFVRTYVQGRAGKRAGARTAQDHATEFHDATLSGGSKISLQLRHGKLDGPVHVAAYPGVPLALLYGIPLIAFLLAAYLDDRLGLHLRLSAPVSAGLAFGIIMHRQATPSSASGAAMGSAVLGFLFGVLAAWVASLLVRSIRPAVAR